MTGDFLGEDKLEIEDELEQEHEYEHEFDFEPEHVCVYWQEQFWPLFRGGFAVSICVSSVSAFGEI